VAGSLAGSTDLAATARGSTNLGATIIEDGVDAVTLQLAAALVFIF
jgi:hypothetical protein